MSLSNVKKKKEKKNSHQMEALANLYRIDLFSSFFNINIGWLCFHINDRFDFFGITVFSQNGNL